MNATHILALIGGLFGLIVPMLIGLPLDAIPISIIGGALVGSVIGVCIDDD